MECEEVEKKSGIVDGKFSPTITKETKREARLEVMGAMNRYNT